jgi:hypothetical protein
LGLASSVNVNVQFARRALTKLFALSSFFGKLFYDMVGTYCGILSFLDLPGPGFTPGWGIKVPYTSFPIACGLANFQGSRWSIGLIWQPTIMVHFGPKNGHFWMPPDLEQDLERG